MLEYLIEKYHKKDIPEVVYRLSYSGKFIIVKGRTLCGSLIIISDTYNQYQADSKRFKGHLYRHLYDHFKANPGGKFRVKVLCKVKKDIGHYALLKREQMELDRYRYSPYCLNNALEAYIPLYNDLTDKYGWLDKMGVLSFKKWLNSKARAAYVKRYNKKPAPTTASYDL